MSCLKCEKGQTSFSYSGADNCDSSIFVRGQKLLDVPHANYANYPSLEVVRCSDCDAVWLADYYFPDHPPLMLGGLVLSDVEVYAILEINAENLAVLKRNALICAQFFEYYEKALKKEEK